MSKRRRNCTQIYIGTILHKISTNSLYIQILGHDTRAYNYTYVRFRITWVGIYRGGSGKHCVYYNIYLLYYIHIHTAAMESDENR